MNPQTEEAQVPSIIPTVNIGHGDQVVRIHEEDNQSRDARRLIRAAKKESYGMIRAEKRARQVKEKPEPKINVYVTLADQVGVKHLEHRVGRREVYEFQNGAWHKFRKKLIQKFRLKGLRWNLWERDGVAWVCFPKVPHMADEDELKLEVYGKKTRTPNSPGSSKRRHFDRPNQRRSKKSFSWVPPQPRTADVSTSVKLAEPGKIGHRELPEISPQNEAKWHENRRTKALEALLAQKESLTVGRSERGKMQTAALSASDEEQRLRREVEELERLKAAKQRLDDRDEWRQQKSAEFRKSM
jgi:hypothetical protein